MSEIKCPFCQQKLDTGNYYVHCHNPGCNTTAEMEGTEEMWAALIRTHEALKIAVDALDAGRTLARIAGFEMLATGMDEAIDKITTLEQKD